MFKNTPVYKGKENLQILIFWTQYINTQISELRDGPTKDFVVGWNVKVSVIYS